MRTEIGALSLTACLTFILSACTTSGMYEELKHRNINDCNRLPTTQRDECLGRIPPDYETYKREREKVVGD